MARLSVDFVHQLPDSSSMRGQLCDVCSGTFPGVWIAVDPSQGDRNAPAGWRRATIREIAADAARGA